MVTIKLRLENRMHITNCMTSNTTNTQTEWSQTLNDIHVVIDTHRLVQHTLQVVEMACTDDSTLAIFFYMRYRCFEKRLDSSDFDIGTVSQATKTTGINKLPCGYVYRSSH